MKSRSGCASLARLKDRLFKQKRLASNVHGRFQAPGDRRPPVAGEAILSNSRISFAVLEKGRDLPLVGRSRHGSEVSLYCGPEKTKWLVVDRRQRLGG